METTNNIQNQIWKIFLRIVKFLNRQLKYSMKYFLTIEFLLIILMLNV